jgi:hypothetical protein
MNPMPTIPTPSVTIEPQQEQQPQSQPEPQLQPESSSGPGDNGHAVIEAPPGDWWDDDQWVKPPYYRYGRQFVLAPNAAQYLFCTPDPQWKGEFLPRRDAFDRIVAETFYPAVEFDLILRRMSLYRDSRPTPFERTDPTPQELELRREFDHAPALMARMRERLGIEEPPTMLPGDLFPAGAIWTDTYITRLAMPDPREYLIRHIRGDWGEVGTCGCVIHPFTRICPGLVDQHQRNLLAVEMRAGLVISVHKAPAPLDRRSAVYKIATLLAGPETQTAIARAD